ncbi:hypothetical protein CALVIDRAFT_567999 [Calocera viscosa TUFC12733]|uniref:DUF6533 domain-containing protein n=1 Tax=Calocera viscosa (strain TUFC12733) TaxID=1330018 RepID=A0A167HJ33_CALVF|nr:hypothetical protein CALVIDRAFT_567999 [Calocera viscosa TUFC12733]
MDSDALLEFLEHAQQGRYVTVAALCLVLHDHLFTCRQEWKFIWIRKWSFSKVLFFLSRYGTLGILLFDLYVALNGGTSDNLYVRIVASIDHGAQTTQLHNMVLLPIVECAVIIEAVLIFRIYAMYHGEKKIMYLLGGLFVCQLTGMAYVLQAGCRGLRAIAEPLPGVHECTITSTISYEYAYWAALLLFETLLFYLSMRKAYEHIRQYTFRFEELVLSRRVGEVLIRDGVMYFPFIFLSYLVNLVLFAVSPQYLAQVAPHAALALRSVLTNRLLLNVSRKFYYPNAGEGRGNDADALTGRDSVLGFIVWASPVRRGPGRSQLGLDTVDGDSGVAGRREGPMRLVRGEGLRSVEEVGKHGLQDEDERLGVLPEARLEGGGRMLQVQGAGKSRLSLSLSASSEGEGQSLADDPLGAGGVGL